MNDKDILKKVDHTLLERTATWEDIKVIIDDAISYGTASVCIPPNFVGRAVDYAAGRMSICTVIGFPNGYSTTASKIFETVDAIENGASEVDCVINVCDVKAGDWDSVRAELNALREASAGRILKIIIECCLLTDDEKIKLCKLVTESGADFIKTSTGFSTGGATLDDVKLLRQNVGSSVKVKAAGGISSLEDAEKFIEAGADRLGTSRIVKILKSTSD